MRSTDLQFHSLDATAIYTEVATHKTSESKTHQSNQVLPINKTSCRVIFFLSSKMQLKKKFDVSEFEQTLLYNYFSKYEILPSTTPFDFINNLELVPIETSIIFRRITKCPALLFASPAASRRLTA